MKSFFFSPFCFCSNLISISFVMNMHVADSCFRHLGICDNCLFLPLYALTLLLCFNVYSSRIVFSAASLSERDVCVASRYLGIRYSGVKAATFLSD